MANLKSFYCIIASLLLLAFVLCDFCTANDLPGRQSSSKTDVEVNIDWFSCDAQLDILSRLLEEKKFYDLSLLSEHLMGAGWGRDKMLLFFISAAKYANGDLHASTTYLEESLKSQVYHCDIVAPAEKNRILNESEIRYTLSELYREAGHEKKSAKELKLSKDLAKRYFGESYSDSVYKKIIEPNAFKK